MPVRSVIDPVLVPRTVEERRIVLVGIGRAVRVVGVLDIFIDAFDPVALGVCVALFLVLAAGLDLRARTRDRAVEPR